MNKWHNLAKVFLILFIVISGISWFTGHETIKQEVYRDNNGCNDRSYSTNGFDCDGSYSAEKRGYFIVSILLGVRITLLILIIAFGLYGFYCE